VGALTGVLCLAWSSVLAQPREVSPAPRPELPTGAVALERERPGEAERAWWLYLRDAQRSQRSWAAADMRGCSSIMIGPNLLISAAHCGAEWVDSAVSVVYASPTHMVRDRFACRYLMHGWPETDLGLFWCEAKDGVNPGDRWGYVDLDVVTTDKLWLDEAASQQRVAIGAGVYSLWMNPIDSTGRNHMLYSTGTIASTEAREWFTSGGDPCSKEDDRPNGIRVDMCGARGASGSAHVSADRYRVLLASNTLAVAPEGRGKWTGSALQYLREVRLTRDNTTGQCAQRFGAQVNVAALQALWDRGYRAEPQREQLDRYYDRPLDEDNNGVFDMQQGLEAPNGQGQRSFYSFPLHSLRQAVQARRNPAVSFDLTPLAGSAGITLNGEQWRHGLLEFGRFKQADDKPYWLRFKARVEQFAAVRVAVGDVVHEAQWLTPGVRSAVLQVSGNKLSFAARGKGRLSLSDITFRDPRQAITFELADERQAFQRGAGLVGAEHAAFFLPHHRLRPGENPPGVFLDRADWAGVVSQAAQVPPTRVAARGEPERQPLLQQQARIDAALPDDLRLFSAAVASPPNTTVRVCFDHRLLEAGGPVFRVPGHGLLRLAGAQSPAVRFSPSAQWQSHCTAPLVTGALGLASVEFRAVSAGRRMTYLVDNLLVEPAR
jgi:hypothetical protein